MSTRRRVIVTSAPPNPNGDLHVGHLSGPFLGADVLRRYLRQAGHDVAYVGYADDFSCYVQRRGGELGHSAAETAHVFGRRMEETLGLANMLPDYFTHPLREPRHAEVVQRFFTELWERGAFRTAELPVFWCQACVRYLYEAEMRGSCQYCAAPSDGFYCEECGRPQETTGLGEVRCTRCGGEPETRTLRRIVFPLEEYRDRLREYYRDKPLRPRLRAYLDDMFSRPLPLTTVSRESGYGVPVPLAGWDGHILDTWYSGIWGYVAATVAYFDAIGEPDAALAAWTDPDTTIAHCIGFDCSFSHAILWPAFFLAHGGFRLPDHVVTNEFYRLEGEKFSTSRGHAIWGGEFLRRVPADPLRFYLCLTGPELEQTSFAGKDFAATVDQLLVGDLQGWVEAVFRLVAEEAGGAVPAAAPDGPSELVALLSGLVADVDAALQPARFSPQRAAAILRDAIRSLVADLPRLTLALGGGTDGADDHGAFAPGLALHLELLARLAAATAPIMPTFSEQVWLALRLPFADDLRRVLPWPTEDARVLTPGQAIAPGLPTLFRSVEL